MDTNIRYMSIARPLSGDLWCSKCYDFGADNDVLSGARSPQPYHPYISISACLALAVCAFDSFRCSSERQMLASWVSNRSIPFLSFSTNVWLFGHIALHHKRKNSETQSQMITEYKQYTMQATFFSDIVVFFGNGKLNYVYSVLLFQRTTMKPKTT